MEGADQGTDWGLTDGAAGANSGDDLLSSCGQFTTNARLVKFFNGASAGRGGRR
jgi:hypothetical protein